MRKSKGNLSWGYHEVAFSARSIGFPTRFVGSGIPGWSLDGPYTTKSPFSFPIPEGAEMLLHLFFTSSGDRIVCGYDLTGPDGNVPKRKVFDSRKGLGDFGDEAFISLIDLD